MPSKKKGRSSNADSEEFKFKKDEKVLILPTSHDQNIYEAKIVECKVNKSKNPQYKIHYRGWNKRWDEWVDQRRVLKINPSNVQIMNEKNAANNSQPLSEQKSNSNTSPSATSTSKKRKVRPPSKSPSSSKSKRRKLNSRHQKQESDTEPEQDEDEDEDVEEHDDEEKEQKHNGGKGARRRRKKRGDEEEESEHPDKHPEQEHEHDEHAANCRPHESNNNKKNGSGNLQNGEKEASQQPLEIKLPRPLKCRLITDWENITKKSMLIALPRSRETRISQILADFEEYAIQAGNDRNIVLEISRGIKDYFNQALHVTLLYKLERKQHDAIIRQHPQLSMDHIYGVEHLCRLFVKLPQLLSPNDLDAETRHILQQQIECMIKFIMNNEAKYFCAQYLQQ